MLYTYVANGQPITDMTLLNKVVIPRISPYWNKVLKILHYHLTFQQELRKKCKGNELKYCETLLKDWISTHNGIGPKTYDKLLEMLCKINEVAPFIKSMIDDLKKKGISISMYPCSCNYLCICIYICLLFIR